jgi:surfactin synthase thioesterase subunit
LTSALGHTVSAAEVLQRPTVAALASTHDAHDDYSAPHLEPSNSFRDPSTIGLDHKSVSACLLLLCEARGASDVPYLFGIPTIDCHAEAYRSLSSCWSGRIYSTTHPHLQTGSSEDLATQSLEDFAAVWAHDIIAECKGQRYCLVGASLGGLLAYEVAAAAQSLEAPAPRRIFLIDPSPPSMRLGEVWSPRYAAVSLAMLSAHVEGVAAKLDPPPEAFDVADVAICLGEFRASLLGYRCTSQMVKESLKQLRSAMHMIGLRSDMRSHDAHSRKPFMCHLFFASERPESGDDGKAAAREHYGGALGFATISSEVEIVGEHMGVCVRCMVGEEDAFNATLRDATKLP